MNDVRLPRLLRPIGGELKEVARLHPISVSVTLSLEPLSAADVELTERDPAVKVHDFMEIYGQNGSLGIFRVESIQTSYTKERKIHLNHAIDVLNDAVMAGSGTITGTVADVLTAVLATQTQMLGNAPFWRLGTCDDIADYEIEYDHGNALECLKGIAEDQNDYYFAFDFSTFPWTMHFLAKNNTVLTEFRLSRNIEDCRVTLDDSELCTRLYLAVDDGDPVAYDNPISQAEWGIVAKTEAVNSEDVQDLADWAADYLIRNAEPRLQISIDGQELNRITGESLDEMHMGRICRVALPEYGVTFQERIVSVNYPNILRTPERVSIALANKPPNMSSSFSSVFRRIDVTQKALSSAHYKWEATDEHVTDIGTIMHMAGLEIDAHGVWAYASEHAEDYALGASFTAQAGVIQSEVTRASEAEGTLSSRITQTETAITQKVSAGDISSTINQTAQSVLIQASKINLVGYATVDDLDATNATIRNLMAGTAVATRLGAGTISATSSLYVQGAEADWHAIGFTGSGLAAGQVLAQQDLNLTHNHSITAAVSGGQVTLTLGAPQSAPGEATFDIAATQFYQDAVAAAYAQGVIDGGGSITVDGIDIETVGDPFFNGQNILMQTIRATAYHMDSGDPHYLGSFTADRSVMSAYNMGIAAGQNLVDVVKGNWSNGYVAFTPSAGTGAASNVNLSTITVWGSGADEYKATVNIYDSGVLTGEQTVVDASQKVADAVAAVSLTGYWSGRHYTVEASNGETQSSGNLSFSGSWGSDATANIYSFDVKDGSTVIFSDAINATSRYNAGRTSVELTDGWTVGANSATYRVDADNGEYASTTLTKVPITPIGSPETFTKIGTPVTVYDYTLTSLDVVSGSGYYVPLSIQRQDVTLQGSRCTTTLYRESGGNYYRYDVPLYFGGSSRTLYSTSGSWKTLYEKKTLNYNIRDDESMDTCYKAGSTITRYTAGTQRNDLYALPS